MSALFEEYWNAGGVILLTYKEFNNLDIESKDTNTNIIGLVVGFAIIIPFTKSSILKIKATLLETGTNFDLDRGYFKDNYGIDIDISWYIADLGVDKSLRRHGIATKLIDLVCSLIPEQKSNKDNEQDEENDSHEGKVDKIDTNKNGYLTFNEFDIYYV